MSLLPELIRDFKWQESRMLASITREMLMTDQALELAAQGTPFREAYQSVSGEADAPSPEEVRQSLINRRSPGGCGQLDVEVLQSRLDALQN